MLPRILIFFLQVLSALTLSFSALAEETCYKVLLPDRIEHWQYGQTSHIREGSHDKASVEVVDYYKDSTGDDFLALKRLHSLAWWSSYRELSFATQGSPTTPTQSLGPYLSQLFGFAFVNNYELIIPGPSALKRRIGIFNRWLTKNHPEVEPIEVSFYWQDQLSYSEYLEKLAIDNAHPIANDFSTHTIHDISYHYSMLLSSSEFLELIRTKARLLSNFLSYVKEISYGNSELRKGLFLWLRFTLSQEVSSVDSISTAPNTLGTIESFKDALLDLRQFFQATLFNDWAYDEAHLSKADLEQISFIDHLFQMIETYYIQYQRGADWGHFNTPKNHSLDPNSFMDQVEMAVRAMPADKFHSIMTDIKIRMKKNHPELDQPIGLSHSRLVRLAKNLIKRRETLNFYAKEFVEEIEAQSVVSAEQ